MTPPTLTTALRETLDVFEQRGVPQTTTEVAEHLDLGRRSTYARLNRLVDGGHLETKKVGGNGRVWWRPSGNTITPSASSGSEQPNNSEQFKQLVESVEEYAIFLLDSDGYIETWDTGAERIKGYRAEEVIGTHLSAFYTADDCEDDIPERNLAKARTHGSYESEGWRVRKDGTQFWANITITAIYDDGNLEGYVKVTRDMTREREYERTLEKQAEQLERQRDELESELDEIFERISDGFYALDDELRFRFINDHAADRLGLDDSAIGRNLLDVIQTTDAFERAVNEALDSRESVIFEDYYDPLGRWFYNAIYPSESGLSVYFRDITEQKEREQERARFKRAVEAAGHAIYMADSDGTITYVNPAFEEMSGYSRSEAIGQTPAILDSQAHSDEYFGSLWETITAGERWNEEITNQRKDGQVYTAHQIIDPVTTDDGTIDQFVAIQTDITERKERERKLEESERRLRTLVENFPNGMVTLVDTDLNYRIVGGQAPEDLDVSLENLEGNTLSEVLPPEYRELLVPRYEAAFEGESSSFTTEFGDQIYHIQIIPVRDNDGDIFAAMAVSQNITQQRKREGQLDRQREQLATLNSLNETIHDITDAILDQSTREEIEEIVCERLASADPYELAWIGDVDISSQMVTVRTEAGATGYTDRIDISIDSNDERGQGPTGRALRTGEIQTTQEISRDSRFEPWRDQAQAHDFRSSAAIPLVHEGSVYGVLNVYASRPNAFEGEEKAVFNRLGQIVGHAIASQERKRALMSDTVVELTFQIQNIFEALSIQTEPAGKFTFNEMVPLGEDEFLIYGTSTEAARETIEQIVEAISWWEAVTFHNRSGDTTFELHLSDHRILSTLASQGGSLEKGVFEDGNYRITVDFPPSADVSRLITAVEELYPSVELVTRKQKTRSRAPDGTASGLEDLTDRQLATLKAAYHSGFFEWPRDNSGEDIAESLGIAPPTFHHHLRKAEKKVVGTVLGAKYHSE